MLDLYADYVRLASQGEFEYWTEVARKALFWCKLIEKNLGV